MKKVIYLMFFVLGVVGLSSCQQESTSENSVDVTSPSITEPSLAFQTIKDSILFVNQNLAINNLSLRDSSTNVSPVRKSFFSKLFKKVLNVFVSDCYGALKGLVKGQNVWQSASSASTSSAVRQLEDLRTELGNDAYYGNKTSRVAASLPSATTVLRSKNIALNDLILTEATPTLNDSVGYYHNVAIYNAMTDNSDLTYWTSLSDKEIVAQLNKEIVKIAPTSAFANTPIAAETVEFSTYISNLSAKCGNAAEMSATVKQDYPELTKHISIMELYLQGMENVMNWDEWRSYCQRLIQIIDRSTLSEKDRESLKAGITVGYASSKLWDNEKFQ